MSAHKVGFDLYAADPMADPGASQTITVDRSPAYVPLDSATAESRTLAAPTRAGAIATLAMRTDGGDITLTVTGGYNEDGDTTFTLSDPGQFITLVACEIAADTFAWRKLSDYSTANITAAEAASLDGILATAAELNVAAHAASASRTSTGVDTITAADNNGIIFLNNATGYATTLPAPIAGFRCTIISILANTSGNHTIVTNSSANIIKGLQNSVAGDAGDSGTADDTISFVANQSVAGDKVELFSDGTSWFAYAISKVAAGITFTQAS